MNLIESLTPLLVTGLVKVIGAILIVILGRIAARLLTRWLRHFLERSNTETTLITFFTSLAYYSLLLFAGLIALGVIGVPMTSLIGVLSASALAVGIALKDSLANLASGVIIIGMRPYVLGDYVELDDVSGYVSEINFFNTQLTTRDNKVVFIPNKAVLDDNLTNYSRNEIIRLDLVFGIGYDDDIQEAKAILEEIVNSHDLVYKDPPPTVSVKELGDSSVNLSVRPYVAVDDEPAVIFSITEQAKHRFDRAGISIPFPQRDIHLYQPNGQAKAEAVKA